MKQMNSLIKEFGARDILEHIGSATECQCGTAGDRIYFMRINQGPGTATNRS